MLVQHALGIAGSAAGVAQHAGIAFVTAGPFGRAILGPDPAFELAVIIADVVADGGPPAAHPLDQRLEHCIVQQHLIFSVIGDVFQLIFEQPRVDRVQHPAHADRAVPADQVARMVHRQRRNPLARLDPQPPQRLRHLQRIAAHPGPGGGALAAIGPARDDLAPAVFARGVIDKVGHPKVPILHSSQHSALQRFGAHATSRRLAPLRRALSDTLATPTTFAKRSAISLSSWKSRPSRIS